MNKNMFLDKFEQKTDAELKAMVSNAETYIDEARLAAIEILEKRHLLTPEIEVVKQDLQLRVREENQKKETHLEEDSAIENTSEDAHLTALYSKRVVTIFSIVFSTVFGVAILMYNMKQTGNEKGRTQVLIFGIVYALGSVVIINTLGIPANFTIFFNLVGAGVLTEYFWNTFIGKDYKFKTLSWVKPAIISVLITVPFALLILYGA